MTIRLLMALFLIATVLTIEGCASPHGEQHTNWAVRSYSNEAGDTLKADEWVCEAFRPIELSDRDTIRTRARIFEHNAVWNALCPEDMK